MTWKVANMWWPFVLEMGVAFFLFVFIVWWTMFHGKKPEASMQSKDKEGEAKPDAKQ
jgi:hypothetical protein